MHFNKVLTKKIAIQLVVELAQDYQVRLHWTKTSNDYGYCRYWCNSISINIHQSPIDIISTFFHEIGHIYCFDNNLWLSYHVNKPLKELTTIERKLYIKTALRAERWVDRWAKKEMSKHFSTIEYNPGYLCNEFGKNFVSSLKKLFYGK